MARHWFSLIASRQATAILLALLAQTALADEALPDAAATAPGAAEQARAQAPAAPPADTAATEPAPAAAEPAPEPPTPEQSRYLQAVEAREAEGGAYDAGLAESLVGLGVAYQQGGRHAEAVASLNRAAHITRVNDGLYSAADLPILERLIESYSALGEWQAVGSSYHQMFEIHRRNYGENDTRLLPALQKLSAWHLRAYLDEIGEQPFNHLLAARGLYDSSLGILQTTPAAAADSRLPDTLRERAIVDYYLAAYTPEDAAEISFEAGPQNAMNLPPNYVLNGFTSGREALERVVELRRADPASSPLKQGEAIAELGDWHQLFNRRQTALELYREAHAVAAPGAQADAAPLLELFGQPRALPVLPRGIEQLAESAGSVEPDAVITVAFAVNERGLAEDIQVLESTPPAADSQISKLRKRLRATRFRPRFEAGMPVSTAGLTYRYRYSL